MTEQVAEVSYQSGWDCARNHAAPHSKAQGAHRQQSSTCQAACGGIAQDARGSVSKIHDVEERRRTRQIDKGGSCLLSIGSTRHRAHLVQWPLDRQLLVLGLRFLSRLRHQHPHGQEHKGMSLPASQFDRSSRNVCRSYRYATHCQFLSWVKGFWQDIPAYTVTSNMDDAICWTRPQRR